MYMQHAVGGGYVMIRKPGPHNGGGQVSTLNVMALKLFCFEQAYFSRDQHTKQKKKSGSVYTFWLTMKCNLL